MEFIFYSISAISLTAAFILYLKNNKQESNTVLHARLRAKERADKRKRGDVSFNQIDKDFSFDKNSGDKYDKIDDLSSAQVEVIDLIMSDFGKLENIKIK